MFYLHYQHPLRSFRLAFVTIVLAAVCALLMGHGRAGLARAIPPTGFNRVEPPTANTVTIRAGESIVLRAFTVFDAYGWATPNAYVFTSGGDWVSTCSANVCGSLTSKLCPCWNPDGSYHQDSGSRLEYVYVTGLPGRYNVSIHYVGPAWLFNPDWAATWDVEVLPAIAVPPPSWEIALATAGGVTYQPGTWTNRDVFVTVTCRANPNGYAVPNADGVSYPGGALTASGANQSVSSLARGLETVSCTDSHGQSAPEHSVMGINIDKDAPQLFYTGFPVQVYGAQTSVGYANATDLLTSVAHVDCKETSGAGMTVRSPSTNPGELELTLHGAGTHVLSCTATDTAGNTTPPLVRTVTFGVDTTPPVISYQGASPAANANGWNNTPVTLTWSCVDAESGVENATVTRVITTSNNAGATGVCRNNAGLISQDSRGNIFVDQTAPVTSASVTAVPAGGVRVVFDALDGESGVAQVSAADPTKRIEYSVDGGPWTIAVTPLFATDPNAHSLRVRATDRAGNVEASNSLTPPVPSGQSTVTAGASSLTFAWAGDTNAETSYAFAYSQDEGHTYQFIALPINTPTSTVTGLAPGTRVYAWLSTCFYQACSAWGPAAVGVTDATAPAVPMNFRVTGGTASTVNVTWDDVSGETSYQLVSTIDLATYPAQTLAANTTQGVVSGLADGTTVYLWLRACNGALCSGYVGAIVAVTGSTPATPANLRAGTVTPSSVQLVWDDVSGETHYYLASSKDGGANWQFTKLAANTTQGTVSGLSTGVSAYLTVAACNGSDSRCSAFATPLLLTAGGGGAPTSATPTAGRGGATRTGGTIATGQPLRLPALPQVTADRPLVAAPAGIVPPVDVTRSATNIQAGVTDSPTVAPPPPAVAGRSTRDPAPSGAAGSAPVGRRPVR